MTFEHTVRMTLFTTFLAAGLTACCGDIDTSNLDDGSGAMGASASPASSGKSAVKSKLCKGTNPITDKAEILKIFKPMIGDKGIVYLDVYNNSPDDKPVFKKGADLEKPIGYNVGTLCYKDSKCSGNTCERGNDIFRTVLMFDGDPPMLQGVFTGLGTGAKGADAANSKAKQKEWEAMIATSFGGGDTMEKKDGDKMEKKDGDKMEKKDDDKKPDMEKKDGDKMEKKDDKKSK